MKIPKTISKNNREYIFEKQMNKNVFLYKEKKCGYKECFNRQELGLITEKTNMISIARKRRKCKNIKGGYK